MSVAWPGGRHVDPVAHGQRVHLVDGLRDELLEAPVELDVGPTVVVQIQPPSEIGDSHPGALPRW
jgi:hypothetical protein